jgi:hypothetical protein
MDTATATQHLTDYLSGYGRANKAGLAEVAAYPAWQARAQAELERRMTRLMETLPDGLVASIAAGKVDLTQVARSLLGDRQ